MMPPGVGGVDIPALMKQYAEYEFISVGTYSGKPYLVNVNDKGLFTFNFDGRWISYEVTRRKDGKVTAFSSFDGETENYVCEGPLSLMPY